MVTVHTFPEDWTTGNVYDATQCDDRIKFGDVLVCPAEKVVGVLVSAWPCAVTKRHGELHAKDPACSWEKFARQEGDSMDYLPGVLKAQEVARGLGWTLDEPGVPADPADVEAEDEDDEEGSLDHEGLGGCAPWTDAEYLD